MDPSVAKSQGVSNQCMHVQVLISAAPLPPPQLVKCVYYNRHLSSTGFSVSFTINIKKATFVDLLSTYTHTHARMQTMTLRTS